MGNFFTSMQIYDPQMLDSKHFIDRFCREMSKEGYTACNNDESELSYILKFADNCKWVTICSEAYEEGNTKSKKDTGRIAKMLKTICVNTTVIDSDCATLDLYDVNGQKADTVIMGRADDYFGYKLPEPSEKIWEPFLNNESTWKQFLEIQHGDYVFVEKGLSTLAPVLGMDSKNILFSAEDTGNINEKECCIFFKKADNKDQKKLTINAAFKQIFGEALEPLGFVKPKLRQPYYVRLIDDEILHIVGIQDMKTHVFAFGGIATVYRPELCLDKSYRQNERWLRDVNVFYSEDDINSEVVDSRIVSGYYYHKDDNASILEAVTGSLEGVLRWIIPEQNNVTTLRKFRDYQAKYFGSSVSLPSLPLLPDSLEAPYNDGAIPYVMDDPMAELERRVKKAYEQEQLEDAKRSIPLSQDIIDDRENDMKNSVEESKKEIYLFQENSEIRQQTLAELARRKEKNTEMLHTYGVI